MIDIYSRGIRWPLVQLAPPIVVGFFVFVRQIGALTSHWLIK